MSAGKSIKTMYRGVVKNLYPALLPAACFLFNASAGEHTRLKLDEQLIFFPAIAEHDDARGVWRAEVTGCVFEPQRARPAAATLRKALELKIEKISAEETEIFNRRARLFLVDHERGKKVFIRLGTNEFYVGKSGADGMFRGVIEFGDDCLEGRPPFVSFTALLSPEDSRQFAGRIFPLADDGISVISDIDDTIKITEVRDRRATVRNTFLREFQPAPGMAEFYQTLARANRAAFHYVSASPRQLFEPLDAFTRSNGFPAGTFHLKPFRWTDRTFFSLFADPAGYKLGVIEPLLKQFPKRKFILIGDSGERDPEIYGGLARRFPEQIERICIRDVTGEPEDAPRFAAAFRELPRARWRVFRDPGEIPVPAR